MSTYVLMKILESSPERYDKGIRFLSLGQLDKAYQRLVSPVRKDQKVLDIGCGTGALTLRAARKGAQVKGIDINPQMLEIARKRVKEANLSPLVEFQEMGIAELESEPSASYDVVVSGLCFSELSEDELTYALKQVKRLLKPGGLLLIADEVKPNSPLKRLVNFILRFPLMMITYLISQTTTHALVNLPKKIEKAGFRIESIRLNSLENFMEIVATNPKEGTK